MTRRKSSTRGKSNIHNERIKCETCEQILKSKKYYGRHIKAKHPVKSLSSFNCDYDGKSFANKNYLRIHMEKHKSEVLICNICTKGYISRHTFRRHLKSHLEKLTQQPTTIQDQDQIEYQCKFCTRTFTNKSSRNTHHSIAHRNNQINTQFKCEICKIYFETKEDLRIHSFIHFEGEIKTCHICNQIFKTTRLLNIHLQKHSNTRYQCENCRETFTFKTGLNKHVRLNRCKGDLSSQNEEVNEILDEEKITEIAVRQLREISKKTEKFNLKNTRKIPDSLEAIEINEDSCDLDKPEVFENSNIEDMKEPLESSKIQKSSVILKTEQNLTDQKKEQKVSRNYKKIKNLKISKNLNSKSSLSPSPIQLKFKTNFYTCDKCGKILKFRKNIENHMKMNHMRKKYKCFHCSDTLKSRREFKEHSSKVHGIHERIAFEVYTCEFCDKKFDIKSIFEAHKMSHTDVRQEICSQCGMRFKSVGNLRRHENSVHAESRDFFCAECGKNYKTKSALRVHRVSVHASIRIYINCPHSECKAIVQEKNLKSHILNHHTSAGQVKAFKCPECEKSFKSESLLKRHRDSVHIKLSRGVTYNCTECELNFSRQRDLKSHMFVHFDGIVHECECGRKFKTKRLLLTHSTNHCVNRVTSKISCELCFASFYTAGGRRKHMRKVHNNTNLIEIDESLCKEI